MAAVAGDGIKKVCLELGGKSAFVVLDDAPFEKAIPAGVNNCMQNSGQTCSAWTRLLVPLGMKGTCLTTPEALKAADPWARRHAAHYLGRLGPLARDAAALAARL